MTTFQGSTSPGLTVSIPNWGSGPGLQDVRITVNAPSSVGNWNPPQTGLVSYYDPVRGETVTETFPMGGSHGPSVVVVRTGSFAPGAYAGSIDVLVPQGGIIPNLPPRVLPGAIGDFLKSYGLFNNAVDMVNSSVTVGVNAQTTNIVPIDLNANYPPGYLEGLGLDPNNLPNGLTGQFDPDGNLIGFERTECFGPATPIDMWPLDPSLKPGPDGVYDQDAVRAGIWKKPIAAIRKGDLVVSFDKDDNLVPGTVSRTFENEAKILLDYFGTRVTPGHVYYRPDSRKADKFEALLDILRDDGMIQNVEGVNVRAATNVPVDDPRDGFVRAVVQERGPDGTVVVKDEGRIRLGTRFVVDGRSSACVADVIEAQGGTVGKDELVRVGGGAPAPFVWEHGAKLPKPEDFVLEASGTSLVDIYKAAEWESRQPHMPAPMVMDGGPVQPLSATAKAAMPRNQPLGLEPVATAPTPKRAARPPMNRKQRKAAEARARKAAKASRRTAAAS